MKIVIVVTKGNAVLAVWTWNSSEGNKDAISQAAAMATKAGWAGCLWVRPMISPKMMRLAARTVDIILHDSPDFPAWMCSVTGRRRR